MVLVPVVPASTRPCQLWRGVVRSPGWNADSWICVIMGRKPELHGAEVCKRSMHAAKNRGEHRDSVPPRAQRSGAGRGSKLRAEDGKSVANSTVVLSASNLGAGADGKVAV
eukprot:scaffold33265_cov58-Phaeocystis_antarctica.AAC.6